MVTLQFSSGGTEDATAVSVVTAQSNCQYFLPKK